DLISRGPGPAPLGRDDPLRSSPREVEAPAADDRHAVPDTSVLGRKIKRVPPAVIVDEVGPRARRIVAARLVEQPREKEERVARLDADGEPVGVVTPLVHDFEVAAGDV